MTVRTLSDFASRLVCVTCICSAGMPSTLLSQYTLSFHQSVRTRTSHGAWCAALAMTGKNGCICIAGMPLTLLSQYTLVSSERTQTYLALRLVCVTCLDRQERLKTLLSQRHHR